MFVTKEFIQENKGECIKLTENQEEPQDFSILKIDVIQHLTSDRVFGRGMLLGVIGKGYAIMDEEPSVSFKKHFDKIEVVDSDYVEGLIEETSQKFKSVVR